MRQVFYQNIQTIVLIIQELLGPARILQKKCLLIHCREEIKCVCDQLCHEITRCDWCEEIFPGLSGPEWHPGPVFSTEGSGIVTNILFFYLTFLFEVWIWLALGSTDPACHSTLVLVEASDLGQVCRRWTLDLETLLKEGRRSRLMFVLRLKLSLPALRTGNWRHSLLTLTPLSASTAETIERGGGSALTTRTSLSR